VLVRHLAEGRGHAVGDRATGLAALEAVVEVAVAQPPAEDLDGDRRHVVVVPLLVHAGVQLLDADQLAGGHRQHGGHLLGGLSRPHQGRVVHHRDVLGQQRRGSRSRLLPPQGGQRVAGGGAGPDPRDVALALAVAHHQHA
jgi:hypothetical protein